MGQRTQIMNMMHGHFAEVGIVVAQGPDPTWASWWR